MEIKNKIIKGGGWNCKTFFRYCEKCNGRFSPGGKRQHLCNKCFEKSRVIAGKHISIVLRKIYKERRQADGSKRKES